MFIFCHNHAKSLLKHIVCCLTEGEMKMVFFCFSAWWEDPLCGHGRRTTCSPVPWLPWELVFLEVSGEEHQHFQWMQHEIGLLLQVWHCLMVKDQRW